MTDASMYLRNYYKIPGILVSVSVFFLMIAGCNQNDSQREFEQQAYSLASGITQTNERGDIINGNEDPDDWRVAPFFQGLVQVDPAFPNPAQTNEHVYIEIHITGIDAVSGLRVFVLYETGNLRFLHEEFSNPLPTGRVSVILNPLTIAQFQENPQGTYRIIIEDYNRNVITYGDIRIE